MVNVMLGTISDVLSVISVLISAAAFGFAVYTGDVSQRCKAASPR